MNISAPLRTAIIADSVIAPLLASYRNQPSVFTRRPVPPGAAFPYILTTHNIAVRDKDFLTTSKPIVVRDIMVYGEQKSHFRDVETIGYRLYEIFHRQPEILTVPGAHVVEITAFGPVSAPVADDQNTGLAVTLTVHLQKQ